MRIEFQVEEPSMEATLIELAPRLVGQAAFKIINYRSKAALLKKLPDRLRAYRARLPQEDIKIVVLLDSDSGDCVELKRQLEGFALQAGLRTKSSAEGDIFDVVNRIVCQELEAWFFGDAEALRSAFPRLPKDFERKRRFRNPDSIPNTWEALDRLLRQSRCDASGSKIDRARRIAGHMVPARNTSPSFRTFLHAVEAMQF